MKNQLSVVFYCLVLVLMASSCQKKYERLDLVLPGDTTVTPTTTPTGNNLLVKTESKTTGSTEASTSVFTYNANSKLVKINTVDVDSANKTTTTYFLYVRDLAGKITSIVTNAFAVNNPGGGISDSVKVNVHYPSGVLNYDYTTYSLTFGGVIFKDSTAFVYNSGVVTDQFTYRSTSGSTPTLLVHLQYVYKNNNVVAEKVFDPTVNTTSPSETYTYDYDTKVVSLFTGNEGFLPGQDVTYASKNNPLQVTINDNTQGTVLFSVFYTLQYNSNNMPTSAAIATVPASKTTNVTFTYQ
jgi:hypothetical protein